MFTIYLIRHGETDGNAANLAQGHFDAPLNAQGKVQAGLLGARIKDWDVDAVYSSDSTRALQTAEPFLSFRDELTLETSSDLREKFYGELENKSWEQLRDDDPEMAARLRDPRTAADVRFPGGETDRDHFERVASFIDYVVDRHSKDATILIFTHGGSVTAATAYLCKLRFEDKFRLQVDNTGISSMVTGPSWRGDDFWKLNTWNDTHHLNGHH